jgi:hypothetical protein
MEPLDNSTENVARTGISPALASFTTGAATTILTIVATLVSLRSDASRESLFLVLSWAMYVAAASTFVVVAWILLDATRRSLRELHHLSELEAHVPRLLRFRRRFERVQISIDGTALVHLECEVESARGAFVPWLTVPFFGGADPDGAEWQSFSIRRVSVDGVDINPASAFTRESRTTVLNDPKFPHMVLEKGSIRVPISLEPNRRRCAFVVDVEMPRAYAAILEADLEDDSYFTDVVYVTNEINIQIEAVGDLRVSASPRADFRVEASQLSGELLDTTESQLQSANCSMRNGIQWRSTNAKIGYRYGIPISAQRLASISTPTSTR